MERKKNIANGRDRTIIVDCLEVLRKIPMKKCT